MQRNPRQKNETHLAFIRTLPCLVCLDNVHTEAAHIRYSDARVAKPNAGVGAKPHDFYCVPLCNSHHALQHNVGDERTFWNGQGIDPIVTALALYAHSGDFERGTLIVANAQRREAA